MPERTRQSVASGVPDVARLLFPGRPPGRRAGESITPMRDCRQKRHSDIGEGPRTSRRGTLADRLAPSRCVVPAREGGDHVIVGAGLLRSRGHREVPQPDVLVRSVGVRGATRLVRAPGAGVRRSRLRRWGRPQRMVMLLAVAADVPAPVGAASAHAPPPLPVPEATCPTIAFMARKIH